MTARLFDSQSLALDPTLGGQALSLLIAVVASTVLAIAAGAVTFVLVARVTGAGDD